MPGRYAERTGQPDRTAEVASHGEGAVNSGMYSGVDSVEDYRVDSGMDAGWILGMIMGWILGNAAFLVCEAGLRKVQISERKFIARKGRLGPSVDSNSVATVSVWAVLLCGLSCGPY